MSHVSMILSALLLMAMAVVMAPNIFALNRGRALRNVALWLAIFLALGLIYQNFGPGSVHPLFQLPASMAGMRATQDEPSPPLAEKDGTDHGDKDFTPPSE